MITIRTVSGKLSIVITLCSIFIFTAIIGYFHHSSRQTLEKELEHNARNLTFAAVNRVETELTAIGKVVEGVAASLETGAFTETARSSLLKKTLDTNQVLYGIGAAFEPGTTTRSKPVVPYFYRKDGQLISTTENNFQFLSLDWYRMPKEQRKMVWVEPYLDQGSGAMLMSSCSLPFFEGVDDKRRFLGVVVADVSLDWLTEIVSSIKPLTSGYSFLISRKGTILAHPRKELVMNETMFSSVEISNNPVLRTMWKKIAEGESGFTPYTDTNGSKNRMYYAPVASTGWTLAVVFPEVELFAEAHSLTATAIGMGVIGILLLTCVVRLTARSITNPLHLLADATEAVAAGNFDLELPPTHSQDEVGKLTKSFGTMNCALKEYIANLTETTAAKERIQSELKLATDIQASLLPSIFPPFPDRADIELYALMEPAKEVGGDFYDFFFVDDNRICLIIGDVSDKGVPAALYMMVAKTLLKSEALRDADPARVLERVNAILSLDNETSMFVTVFCAVLDTRTGGLACANAGHLPPLLLQAGETAACRRFNPGFVLGPMPGIHYQTEQLTLQPGDLFLLYTDGVNEAVDLDKNEFGEQRLLDCVTSTSAAQPKSIIRAIRNNVLEFAGDAPQSDDITMLALRYLGTPR